MDAETFYRLPAPLEPPRVPEAFSHSSLELLARCARRWQLQHASYPGLETYPERPSEAAEVGKIVHRMLGRLYWAMNRAHRPPLGTPASAVVMEAVDLMGIAKEELGALRTRMEAHQRAGGMRLRATPRELYNSTLQLFRKSYQPYGDAPPESKRELRRNRGGLAPTASNLLALLSQGYALSEVVVSAVALRMTGVIDLLERRDGQTVVVDFKSGQRDDAHERQVLLYALLWWRWTGDLPSMVELRYGAICATWEVSEAKLAALEVSLRAQIGRVQAMLGEWAPATVGPHCKFCPVRQYCDGYWRSTWPATGEWVDEEVVVTGPLDTLGLIQALSAAGVPHVHLPDAPVVSMPQGPWRLRILGMGRSPTDGVLAMVRTTEVFAARTE